MLSTVVRLSKLVRSKSFALTVLICPDWFRSEASSVPDPDLAPAQAGAENTKSNAIVAKLMRCGLIFSLPFALLPGRINAHVRSLDLLSSGEVSLTNYLKTLTLGYDRR